jgi:hypothetical protein
MSTKQQTYAFVARFHNAEDFALYQKVRDLVSKDAAGEVTARMIFKKLAMSYLASNK